MASLLGYLFCMIAISAAAAGVVIGLANVSGSEKVVHYSHPRPVVERNDKEVRVLPKANHRPPAKRIAKHTDKKGDLNDP